MDEEKNTFENEKNATGDEIQAALPDNSIGKILAEKRNSLGITLDQVVESTKIRKKYLEALENDNYKAIPNLLAARGFVKIYGNFLGINVNTLVEIFNKLFPEDAASVNVPHRETRFADRGYTKDLLSKSLRTTNFSSYSYSRQMKIRKTVFMSSAIGGALLLLFIIIISSNFYFKKTVGDVKRSEINRRDAPLPAATPGAILKPDADQDSIVVLLKALNRTWIRVVMDGRVVFTGNLDRGDSKTWTGSQYVTIKAAQPDRLEMIVNGEFIGLMDTGSEMKEMTYYVPNLEKSRQPSLNIETTPNETAAIKKREKRKLDKAADVVNIDKTITDGNIQKNNNENVMELPTAIE